MGLNTPFPKIWSASANGDCLPSVRWLCESLLWGWKAWSDLLSANLCGVFMSASSEFWRWKANLSIRDSDTNADSSEGNKYEISETNSQLSRRQTNSYEG